MLLGLVCTLHRHYKLKDNYGFICILTKMNVYRYLTFIEST